MKLCRLSRVSISRDSNRLDWCVMKLIHRKGFKVFLLVSQNDKKKISTFISFPDELDLTPFLTKSQEGDTMLNRASAKYSLYAVVNHEGRSIDSGHYTSIVRHSKGHWIKCDDLNLTPFSIDKVLSSEGYLLFYHKKILEYN